MKLKEWYQNESKDDKTIIEGCTQRNGSQCKERDKTIESWDMIIWRHVNLNVYYKIDL